LAVGNLAGAVFMALHAAQGPTLGVPQMIQSRGQFGSLGSLLVVGIVIVMYVGFLSSNLVLGGQALATLVPGMSDAPGIALVGVLSVIAAIYGYDLIHAYARVMTYVSGSVLVLSAAWIIWVHGLPADFLSRNAFNVRGLLGIISAAALWQIAYAPYVSDYSRYMPRETGVRPAFWASYWGCTLGSFLPMVLGATVGLAAPQGNLMAGLALLTHGIAPLVLIVFSVGVAAANAMNLYCGALATLTFGQTLISRWSPGPRAHPHRARAIHAVADRRAGEQGIVPGQLRGFHSAAAVCAGPVDRDQPRGLLPAAARPIRCCLILSPGRRHIRPRQRGGGRLLRGGDLGAVAVHRLAPVYGAGGARDGRHRFVLDHRVGGDLAHVLLARQERRTPCADSGSPRCPRLILYTLGRAQSC
jgi:Permease for cytosine/purines, uracil, thiamine, allantoin